MQEKEIHDNHERMVDERLEEIVKRLIMFSTGNDMREKRWKKKIDGAQKNNKDMVTKI